MYDTKAFCFKLCKVKFVNFSDGTSGGTNYLTTKLVEDSLRWQEKHPGYTKADTPSPFSSPVRRPHRTRPLMHEGASAGVLQRPTPPLDPHCLLELERSAKLLASSVDEMTEQLSTVLHDISSVTVSQGSKKQKRHNRLFFDISKKAQAQKNSRLKKKLKGIF